MCEVGLILDCLSKFYGNVLEGVCVGVINNEV